MSKKLKFITLIGILFAITGCYRKVLLFEAETVSMTKKNSGNASLSVGEAITEQWCIGDKVIYTKNGTDLVGMADQAIYKAQGQGKTADFLTEVQVYVDSNNCAIVEGKLASIGGKKKVNKGGKAKKRKK